MIWCDSNSSITTSSVSAPRFSVAYGGRTDSIAIEILADLIRELEYQYPNFNKQMFIEGCTINEDDDLAGTLTNKFGL